MEYDGQLDRFLTTKVEAILSSQHPTEDEFPYLLLWLPPDMKKIIPRLQFLRNGKDYILFVVGLCSSSAVRSILIKNKPALMGLLFTYGPSNNEAMGRVFLSLFSNSPFPYSLCVNHLFTNVEEIQEYCSYMDDFSNATVILTEYFVPTVKYILEKYQTMDRKCLLTCYIFCYNVRHF